MYFHFDRPKILILLLTYKYVSKIFFQKIKLILSLFFADQYSVMAAGPYLHVLIISAGETFSTRWVHPLGMPAAFTVNVMGVALLKRGYFGSSGGSKVLSTELHSSEPFVCV